VCYIYPDDTEMMPMYMCGWL